MNTKYLKKTIYILFICIIGIQFYSCKTSEIKVYDGINMLYIPTDYDMHERFIPFYHNKGKDKIDVKFLIKLIGPLLSEDKEYKLEFIDSLSSVEAADFTLPDKFIFKKDVYVDTLVVTINRTERLQNETATIALQLIDNDNFKVGYQHQSRIFITFNDVKAKPEWWDQTVKDVFFGEYSDRKYDMLFIATGVTTIEYLSPSEVRLVALEFKEYIMTNDIREENNEPMELPIY